MNAVTDNRPGLYESRFPAATITPPVPTPLTIAPLEALPVVAQPVRSALETALANITKLDEGLATAAAARFASRSNGLSRWAATHNKTAALLTAALPAAAAFGAVIAYGGEVRLAIVPSILAGAMGACIGGFWRDYLRGQRAGEGDPLTTSDVASAVALLREMSATERAYLKAHADRSLDRQLERNGLTPAAAESLRDALDEGTERCPAALRLGSVALHVHVARTSRFDRFSESNKWLGELKKLLRNHPPDEKRATATMLLDCCFKDERCTLPAEAVHGDALYTMLRALQKAAS